MYQQYGRDAITMARLPVSHFGNAADEGRQAESYGEKPIDFIIIQAKILYVQSDE